MSLLFDSSFPTWYRGREGRREARVPVRRLRSLGAASTPCGEAPGKASIKVPCSGASPQGVEAAPSELRNKN